MNKRNLIIISVITVFSLLHPVQVKKKDVRDFKSFTKGTFSGTGLTDRGELFISLKSKKINGPEQEYYLGVDVSEKGDIYIGTGHNASLFKIGKDYKITKMFTAQEPDIYAVLYGSDKQVYVGSSPRGKLYKISASMKVKTFFNPDEKYIWDLKEDRTGNIICAVGGSGGVYRIDKKGNQKKILTSVDTHIISLFISMDNSVIAGSGGSGILYKISSKKNRVLYDTPFEEINSIHEDRNGYIWFAASKEIKKSRITPVTGTIRLSLNKTVETTMEKSALYLRHPGGEVEKIWTSNDEYIYSIAADKNGSGVLIGTGDKGRIYKVGKNGSFSLIYEDDSAQAYKILSKAEDYTIIYNNTSSIVKLSNFPDSKGSYISNIFNLGMQSTVGRIYWESLNGNPSAVTVFVRSGNTAMPDQTWTEWSPPFTDSKNSNINRSGNKYIQVKVNLNSTSSIKNPNLAGFYFYYLQKNIKPQLKSIKIKQFVPPKKGSKSKESSSPKNNRLNISWRAIDPNKDEMNYSVFIRKISEKEWITVKKNTKVSEILLETELYEDGDYILKIIADDSSSNSPENSQSDTMESKSFTIDSTAPTLNGYKSGDGFLTFNINDHNSIISTVLYSFNGKKWFLLNPIDKINDSGNETFKLSKKFTKGRRFILIKAIDEYKNSKVFQRKL